MELFKGRRPSPAMVVASLALVVALAGTAIAAPTAIKSILSKKEKKQVKNIANTQVNTLAPGLSVASANNAKAVSDDTISSSKVINGSLRAPDVGVSSGTFNYNSASIPANSCLFSGSQAAPGASVGDTVLVTPPDAFVQDDLDLEAGVLSANNIRINICNPTIAANDPGNLTFSFVVIGQ
jgi:hypothetical protein